MSAIILPEAYSHLLVTGYLLAVNLPTSIRPPRVRKQGVPLGRFDVIGYAGEFPPPLHARYLRVLEQGEAGVLYLRELPKDDTRFSPRAYEYSLALPMQGDEKQRNVTGLEPVYNELGRTPIYLGRPELKEVRFTKWEGATYVIRPRHVGERRGFEMLCLRHSHGRAISKGVAKGVYDELFTALRRQTQPLGWQACDSDFMSWYNVTDIHR